jgi:Fe2+ transport system protein FeoA
MAGIVMTPPTPPGPTPALGTSAVPLTAVRPGAVSTLHEVRDRESRPFLRALGLTDACRIRLCKTGDPCIVQVRTTRIGLSRAVAEQLFVVPDGAGDM